MANLGDGSGTGYPAAIDTSDTEVNSPNAGKTKNRAEPINDLYAAVKALETELGTDPAGSLTDVKTRLAVALANDGTLNSGLTITNPTVSTPTLGDAEATELTITGATASPPDTNTLVKDNIVKVWAVVNMATDAIIDAYNISAVVDGATGDDDLTINTDFANGNYALVVSHNSSKITVAEGGLSYVVGALPIRVFKSTDQTGLDASRVSIIAIGEQ